MVEYGKKLKEEFPRLSKALEDAKVGSYEPKMGADGRFPEIKDYSSLIDRVGPEQAKEFIKEAGYSPRLAEQIVKRAYVRALVSEANKEFEEMEGKLDETRVKLEMLRLKTGLEEAWNKSKKEAS